MQLKTEKALQDKCIKGETKSILELIERVDKQVLALSRDKSILDFANFRKPLTED